MIKIEMRKKAVNYITRRKTVVTGLTEVFPTISIRDNIMLHFLLENYV